MFSDADRPVDIVERQERLVKTMTEATVNGVRGETYFDGTHDSGAALVNSRTKVQKAINRKLDAGGSGIAKSALDAVDSALSLYSASSLAKEWSLGNPISTGLVPFDLEAPAKLLTPRPTPLRNTIPRVKGQGAARRFKVISGFTGTGTGGIGTLQPGITETHDQHRSRWACLHPPAVHQLRRFRRHPDQRVVGTCRTRSRGKQSLRARASRTSVLCPTRHFSTPRC